MTLGAAAGVVLLAGLSSGWVALRAQAARSMARSPNIRGRCAIGPVAQVTLGLVAAGFLAMALLGVLA